MDAQAKEQARRVMQAAEEALNKMDYEGLIGGMKTRFKYKSVAPTSFGLTTEEILLADDRELAQYVSVKKLAPYREKEWMVSGRQRSQFRRNLKQKQKQKQGQAPANNIGNSDSANASAYTEAQRIVRGNAIWKGW